MKQFFKGGEHSEERDHHHRHGHEEEESGKYPRMMVPVTKKGKVFCAPS